MTSTDAETQPGEATRIGSRTRRAAADLSSPRGKNLALLLLAMTQFVVVIDASIVNVALPSIGAHLHFSRDDLSWVVNAYTLTFGGFLLLGGRLADLLGRRRMLMIGLVAFSLASLAGGLSQSEAWLIAARAVQGLGAAIVSPAALSIITTTFAEGAERNRALGVWGAVAGAGGAAGVLLGGILTSGLSWRWVLFVNVPIGIAAATAAPRLLLESKAEDGTEGFDIPGAVTVTAGLALLVYTVVDAVNVGWGSTGTLLRLAGSVILLTAFVVIERRERHPLLPFSIFRLRTLRGADIVGLLIGMSLLSMFFFISLYLQDVLHYSAIKTGLSYLPLAVGIIVSAGVGSQLVTRVGFKPVLIAGLLLIAGGLVWFSQIPATGGSFSADVLGPSLLAAFGLGFSFLSVTIGAVLGTKPGEAGLASGLINTSEQVGGAVGLAILATVANSRTQGLLRGGVHPSVALTRGFDRAFLVGTGFAVVGAILAAVLISSRDSREQAEAARRGELDAGAVSRTPAARPMPALQGIARVTLREGKLDEFKRVAAQCMEIVRTKDTGTLQYDVYFNDDQSECIVHERYRDSEALIEHAAHLGDLNEAIAATGFVSGILLGEPSAELRAMMAESEVRLFAPYQSM